MLLQAGWLLGCLLCLQDENPTTANNQDCEVPTTKQASLEAKLDRILKGRICVESVTEQTTCLRGQPPGNGTKQITLWGNVIAECDTFTDGGGWIVIQRHASDKLQFKQGWEVYKKGFGSLDGDFWIGNDIIHNLTSQGYNQLRINMIYQQRYYFAQYSNFYVANESLSYKLSVGGYSGTAGDSLTYHNNMYFSTPDRDMDASANNCADNHGDGGWWYNKCHYSNLNGQYNGQGYQAMSWYALTTGKSVTFSQMMIRHV